MKMSFDLFDTLVASRTWEPAGHHVDELFPIKENIAKVKPGDLIVSDYPDAAMAEAALRTTTGLKNELIVTPDGKYTGEVWRGLLKRGVFAHCGDNDESDRTRPLEYGISSDFSTLSRPSPNEAFVKKAGFPGIAGAMREARLIAGNRMFGDLCRLQTQVNFPFLLLGSILLLRKAKEYGCKTLLMSARDCCLWKDAVRMLAHWEVRVEYLLTSRIARVYPSESYLKYVNGLLTEAAMFVDLDGTGWSLRRLIEKTSCPESPLFLLVRVPNKEQNDEQERLAPTVDCPMEWVMEGYEIALEPANYARHAMVKDVVDGHPTFTNPTGFNWEKNLEIRSQHWVFGEALSALKNYDLSADLIASEETLEATLATIFGWYRSFSGAVGFQKATFQAEHNHVFETLREQKRTRA